MHPIRFLDQASQDISRLDKSISRRIIERLNWLSSNFEQIRPETLGADLSGFYKFRVGDYRIIYQIIEDEQTILIHAIGHRREIYKKR
ncbi:MAG: type II toxin-antitoxin system RelE/ParE family toxin [Desulfobacteraceae bacterium]|nr:MAG: type II toxin-antitoxin system RelE/ParE family toxin [Desulfobacteraceae bacterium]